MQAAELRNAPVMAATLAELERTAIEGGVFRRCVSRLDELYDLIAPATPDRLRLLDEAGSIFLAEWWTGNDDALAQACEDVAGLLAAEGVIPLTGLTTSPDDASHVGFSFCLALPSDLLIKA